MNFGKVFGKLLTYYGIIVTLLGSKILGLIMVTVGCIWHELTE